MRQKQRVFSLFLLSPSSRRAWIEISVHHGRAGTGPVALLAEGVDRNIVGEDKREETTESPSSRRAWIEIRHPPEQAGKTGVALLAEGVDRNVAYAFAGKSVLVALLAEGVDRNDRY